MPELTRWQALQFILILLAVPLQIFLYEWTGTTSEKVRASSIKRVVTDTRNFMISLTKISTWKNILHDYQTILKNLFNKKSKNKKSQKYSESVAEEVFWLREPHQYYAGSTTPRDPRSSKVKYRVGQVIKHKTLGYYGVIIGWDETCKAPESWIQQMHGHNKHWRTQPNYAILVDTRDRKEAHFTYVVQENIEIVSNYRIKHPELQDYFDFYDGAQYHSRGALKTLYPND